MFDITTKNKKLLAQRINKANKAAEKQLRKIFNAVTKGIKK